LESNIAHNTDFSYFPSVVIQYFIRIYPIDIEIKDTTNR